MNKKTLRATIHSGLAAAAGALSAARGARVLRRLRYSDAETSAGRKLQPKR